MTQAGFFQQPPRPQLAFFCHQNATRQDAQRPLQNTHVLIKNQWPKPGALKQSHDCRNQDSVIGTDELTHGFESTLG